MKTFLTLLVFAFSLAAQSTLGADIRRDIKITPGQPSADVVAAYFKAEGAASLEREQYNALVEKFKAELAASIQRQIQTTVQAIIAGSQLQQACGELMLDQQALAQREVKCIPKPK